MRGITFAANKLRIANPFVVLLLKEAVYVVAKKLYRFSVLFALLLLSPAEIQAKENSSLHYTSLNSILKSKNFITLEGNEIEIIQLGKKESDYKFFIQSGLHGNEKLPPQFVIWLAKRFNQGKSLLNKLNKSDVSIDFVPHSNPDGIRVKSRYNANGVNLNRNYSVLWGISKKTQVQTVSVKSKQKLLKPYSLTKNTQHQLIYMDM